VELHRAVINLDAGEQVRPIYANVISAVAMANVIKIAAAEVVSLDAVRRRLQND